MRTRKENIWINSSNAWVILGCLAIFVVVGKSIDKTRAQENSVTRRIVDGAKEPNSTSCKVMVMKITAYCPCEKCCGRYAGRKTTFGEDPWETPGVAAKHKILPVGTILEIPGIGIMAVDANGGKDANEKEREKGIECIINLRMKNHEEAKKFGVKVLPVKILGSVKLANASEVAPGKTVLMKVTGYCPCKKCCGKYAALKIRKTPTGRNPWNTVGVATDPNLLPYGTKLNIPGVGLRIVDDNGGDMRQGRKAGICWIDVRFPNHQEAEEFGIQWLNVKIL